jgi:tripartite-type tricarboxylate transporter receptor subunit TctC
MQSFTYLVRSAVFCLLALAGAGAASALDYPTKPVRFVVAYPAGGSTDILARLIGQYLSERLGQQFVIDNRPGASGNIATEAVIRAPADGYTLLLAMSANAINASLYENLRFNFTLDAAPVTSIGRIPLALEINPSLPTKTIPEFIAYAKANPGKLNMASAGIGGSDHIAGELFKMMAGIDMIHVPYRGGAQVMTDLIAGQVQVSFIGLVVAIEHIRSGKLRALAVTTASRTDVLPDIPTVGDFVPGYEASSFWGVGAPRNTPADIIDTLNREINAGLSDPKLRLRLAQGGGAVYAGSPADFGKFLGDETEKWAKVIKFAGVRPE